MFVCLSHLFACCHDYQMVGLSTFCCWPTLNREKDHVNGQRQLQAVCRFIVDHVAFQAYEVTFTLGWRDWRGVFIYCRLCFMKMFPFLIHTVCCYYTSLFQSDCNTCSRCLKTETSVATCLYTHCLITFSHNTRCY